MLHRSKPWQKKTILKIKLNYKFDCKFGGKIVNHFSHSDMSLLSPSTKDL